MTTTKLTQCPKCGCKENESSGNDFHCKDCPYIQCGETTKHEGKKRIEFAIIPDGEIILNGIPYIPKPAEPTGAGMRGWMDEFNYRFLAYNSMSDELLNRWASDATPNEVSDFIKARLSRLHSRIVEEVEKMKHEGREINYEEDNEAAIENRTLDEAQAIINHAFKDL